MTAIVGVIPIGRIAGYVELYSVPDDSDAQSVLELPIACRNAGPHDLKEVLDFVFNEPALVTAGVA